MTELVMIISALAFSGALVWVLGCARHRLKELAVSKRGQYDV